MQNPRDISPLKFGMSQDEVIEIFGKPDAVSTMRSGGKPLILKYHDIELHFDKDQESILMQKNACHDFAEKKGWNIVGEEQEIGVSGYKVSTDDLVKLKRIRKAAEQGEFDILLVFMYDRLGRNLNETPFIAEWFTKKGIHVWSVYEGEIIDGVDAERMLDYIRFWQTDEAQKL